MGDKADGAEHTLFHSETGDPLTTLHVGLPTVVLGNASGAVWLVDVGGDVAAVPGAALSDVKEAEPVRSVEEPGEAKSAGGGEEDAREGDDHDGEESTEAAAEADPLAIASEGESGEGGAPAATPKGTVVGDVSDAPAGQPPGETVGTVETKRGASDHSVVIDVRGSAMPLHPHDPATFRLKPFSDEAIKGAYTKSGMVYFVVGDVSSECWLVQSKEKLSSIRFNRGGRHTYHTCPLSSTFLEPPMVAIVVASQELHCVCNVETGAQKLERVVMPRRELPIFWSRQAGVVVTKDEGAQARKEAHVWGWLDGRDRERKCDIELHEKSSPAWGFKVDGGRVFACQGASVLAFNLGDGAQAFSVDPSRRDIAAFEIIGPNILLCICEGGRLHRVVDGKVAQSWQLPRSRTFELQLPYLVRYVDLPDVEAASSGVGGAVVYNDDRGVHWRYTKPLR